MSLNEQATQLFSGFSKLNRKERLARLKAMGALTQEDINLLNTNHCPEPHLAEKFIENVVGYFSLPLGVATNFNIDGKDRVIPMAVEETSIVAALCKTAKWIRNQGEITTNIVGDTVIGQIQIAKVKDFSNLAKIIKANETFLIEQANEDIAKGLVRRGGGVKSIHVRQLEREDGQTMAVIHIHADTCDAMGANTIIQICEFLKDPIEQLTGETVTMCILSNLNDSKLVQAKVVLNNIDAELGNKIEEASRFAEIDPYRAATNNKGILNGIDPVLIATGNDWRAVEAGIHAYAAKDGQYRSISKWRYNDGQLIGTFSAPIIVGTVGGVTRLHPTAQMCLRMLDVNSSNELAKIIAAVGLVQNLGALRALITLGFTEGHLKLHISNLTLSAGAKEEEIPILKKRLEELLAFHKRITLSNAKEILAELRQTNQATTEQHVTQ